MSQTAIITGASQGIGACIAKRLAKDGFNIAINSIAGQEENAAAVKKACEEFGVEAGCFFADVSDFKGCEQMIKEIKERFGTIDVLVNNAGVTKDGLIARMSEEQFDFVTSVNYKGVFNMIRHVTPVMMRQRSGRIVNITSVAGLYGNPGQINYSASKAGVVGMTLSASKELGPRNITVNAVAPGFIETPMTAVLDDKYKEEIKAQISLRRFGQTEDIANAVSFLAGKDSSYITGQVIVVDGGMVM